MKSLVRELERERDLVCMAIRCTAVSFDGEVLFFNYHTLNQPMFANGNWNVRNSTS